MPDIFRICLCLQCQIISQLQKYKWTFTMILYKKTI
jgi:hypothetical protein